MYSVITKNYTISFFWIGIHVLLGIVVAFIPAIAKLWGIIPLALGLYFTTVKKNGGNEAGLWAAYYVGLEVLLRVTGGGLSWEFGKYAVILFLIYGLFVEQKWYQRNIWWVFFIIVLLVPAIFFTFGWSDDVRDDILFNISGMMALCVAVAYFYKRALTFDQFTQLLSYLLMPIISLCFVLFIKTPDVSSINFTTAANFKTSGGFGPNQVATVLGVGWVIILICFLYQIKYTRFLWLDIILFAFILYRSLFTFSRGGNLGAFLGILAFLCIHILNKNFKIVSPRVLFYIVLLSLASFIIVIQLDNITSGAFVNRFTGRDAAGDIKEDATSGRINIVENELLLFKEYPLGVGVGGSSTFRKEYLGDDTPTHNEFGRLISEHGVFGIIVIAILIIVPGRLYFKLRYIDNRAFLVFFLIISFSTMMHSAMRIALPAFFYGLSMIYLYPKQHDIVYRQQTV